MRFFSFLFSPKGRFTRRDFFVALGLCMGLSGFYLLLVWKFMAFFTAGVQMACVLFILWIFTAASARRLHDIGYSGWTALWYLVPPVTLYVLYLVMAVRGSPGRNDYGLPRGKKAG